jgi:hypothetical protein
MQGVFIRSRAKWNLEGEKPSRYFCNMENRYNVSKTMKYFYDISGTLLTDQKEILQEVAGHYKKL